MKRFAAVFLVLAAFCLAIPARATLTATNLLNLSVISNTTSNGNSFSLTGVYLPPRTFIIQNNGLANTNALTGSNQFSLDGSNWVTLSIYQPAVTNSMADTYTPNVGSVTIYQRIILVTTNSVTAGVTMLQTQ